MSKVASRSPLLVTRNAQNTVRDAWAVMDLTIPFKHIAVCKKMEQWPQLEQVPFPEVGRKKVSVLIGTSVQEAKVKRPNPN